MIRAKHMGFKSVRRVEVKAETTTPGETRTTTDASGTRVSTSRGRRTLPKLEFTVDEDGAVLHGPQRGSYPFYATASANPNALTSSTADNNAETSNPAAEHPVGAAFNAAVARDLAASFQQLHMRDFPSPPSPQEDLLGPHNLAENNQRNSDGDEDGCRNEEDQEEEDEREAAALANPTAPSQMKECVLNDTRATTLAVKYDHGVGKFVCGSSIERFSGHTGVCRVLGSKKYTPIPHSLRIGDLLRIGSVGLVVCEINRTDREETQEALSAEQYAFLKENYLSLPLQQTFHPTERSPDELEDQLHDLKTTDHERTMRIGGETSDEGESEEDRKGSGGENNGEKDGQEAADGRQFPMGVSGVVGKKFCYICYDGDEDPEANPLVAPCHCKGDTKYVHLDCLQRWNNNLDADGTNPNQKVCAVTNTDGLDVCSICKATYLTSVRLDDGRLVSLLAKKLPPPYVTFAVVTQHETRNRSTALTNTRFQLSFANLPQENQELSIGRSTVNHMTLRYRTVSQVHAKIRFKDGHFFLTDEKSSNGTMLFLSRPLELDWNTTMHVKIGRTVLTLKAKKKWRWGGTGDEPEEEVAVTSPRSAGLAVTPRAGAASSPVDFRSTSTRGSHVASFEMDGPGVISDPSAELVAVPYPGTAGQLTRTLTAPNVLGSRSLNHSTASSTAQYARPMHRSFSSTAPSGLASARSDADDVALDASNTGAFHVDELAADEADPFMTQRVHEPVSVARSETTYRDFAAENASTVHLHAASATPQRERVILGLLDSLTQMTAHAVPGERGASPVVAARSSSGLEGERE